VTIIRRLLLSAALVAVAAPAAAADRIETGTIARFECGDNCYLSVKTAGGEELVGLCVADACTPWLEEAAMPADMIGKPVTVTVGTGQQVDNEGTVMGDFPAFTSVVIGE
jgi:hypothetical protein